ncbi:unnamed protein product, partial [Oikopleura dioica]
DIEEVVAGIPSWLRCRRCQYVMGDQSPEVRYTQCGCRSVCKPCHDLLPKCELCKNDRDATAQPIELVSTNCSTCKDKTNYLAASQKYYLVSTKVKREHNLKIKFLS